MESVILESVILKSVILQTVIRQTVILQTVILQTVILLKLFQLNVTAPYRWHSKMLILCKYSKFCCSLFNWETFL